jgi:UDP-galactopyranose mutase
MCERLLGIRNDMSGDRGEIQASSNIEVKLSVNFFDFIDRATLRPGCPAVSVSGDTFDKIVYTGMIDEFFDYKLGHLEYRSLRFENEIMSDIDNYQGNAVVNYTEREIPYTRIIEHKHFEFGHGTGTVITREYPAEWKPGDEPYYPMNDSKNNSLYEQYRREAADWTQVYFGGRLGQYRYFNMDQVVRAALDAVKGQQ